MSKPKYVYFIKPVGMDGPIKIGCSAVPPSRLIEFTVWSPFPLEIIGSVPGGHADETFLHRRFAYLHSHREWFRSSPLLRNTIDRILHGESLKSACAEILRTGMIRNQRRKPPTAERQQFIDYGKKIRLSTRGMHNDQGIWYAPPDVKKIMEDWRGDYLQRKPVTPNVSQIARIDEFLSDPRRHAVFLEYGPNRVHRDHDVALAEAFEKQMAASLGAAQ